MTKTEETLRAATREHAGQVTPSSIAPLDLAGIPFDRPRFLRRRAGRIRLARPGLLVPVLAALAVVVLVAASLALPRVLSSHGQPATPALTVPAGVPPYYLTLAGTGTPAVSHPQDVTVVDTRTGQRLATVTPPKGFGTFSYIIGGGAVDDRTWVVGASIWKPQRLAGMVYPTIQPLTFFLLTFDPRYQVIRLRQLPGFTVTAPRGTPGAGTPQQPSEVQSLALSPDGSRLAVAVSEGSAMKLVIHVTPLVPGAHGGTWVLPGSLATGGMRGPLLTWAADERTLSIATMQDFIFLDTARPSGELLAASRVVPFTGKTPAGTPYACFGSAVMSLDATTMTCAGAPSANLEDKIRSVGIVTISARTGVPLSYMPIQQPYHPWVTGDSLLLYWASPTGPDEYIAFPAFVANGHATPPRITVWRNGKLAETIPWPVGVNTTGTVGDFVW